MLARVDSKVDKNGFNIPINLQDRKLWERKYFNSANQILKLASVAPFGASGRFFYEALIAKEHCHSINFEQTDWSLIVEHYEKLIQITNSPVARLNQAIAIGYTGDTKTAIKLTESLSNHKALKYSHMPLAILAHLYAKTGDKKRAHQLAIESKQKGGTPHEYQLMMLQIERLLLNKKSHV